MIDATVVKDQAGDAEDSGRQPRAANRSEKGVGTMTRRQSVTTATESLVDPPTPSIRRTEMPPGPSGLPLVGQAFRLRSDFVGLLRDAATYGDVSTVSVNPLLIHLVNHPDLNRQILVTDHQKTGRGAIAFETIRWMMGDGLTASTGAFHLRQRRLLHRLPIPSTRRFRAARAYLDELIYGLIRERRLSGAEGDDLLCMLLQVRYEDAEGDEDRRMSDELVRDEAVSLYIAGHDTTATTLAYAFHLLSHNPEVEKRFPAPTGAGDTPIRKGVRR